MSYQTLQGHATTQIASCRFNPKGMTAAGKQQPHLPKATAPQKAFTCPSLLGNDLQRCSVQQLYRSIA